LPDFDKNPQKSFAAIGTNRGRHLRNAGRALAAGQHRDWYYRREKSAGATAA
jgi:hypothetical protein